MMEKHNVFWSIIFFFCIVLTGNAQERNANALDSVSRIMHFHIYYPVNTTEVHEDYMDNSKNLQKIKDYLRYSHRIDSMVIYSYASPEGSYTYNKLLAEKRGISAKKYILQQVPAERNFDESLIVLKPDAENWAGLKEIVQTLYKREDQNEVLSILESDEGNERKKTLLKRLDGGRSWQYIIKNIMPQLRYATWISVWQQIPGDKLLFQESVPLLIPDSNWQLANVRMYATTQAPESKTDTRTILALKTNLLYDAVSWLNFSVEVPVYQDKYSVLYYHQFPWWRWGKGKNEFCMRFLSIGLEGRWWFKPMPRESTSKRIKRDKLIGHFLGMYAESGKWDFERKRDVCYQGEHWSAGFSYGYSMPIGKRLNLEFSVSAGYASIVHRGFEPAKDYSELYHLPEKDGTWHYVGPTKAQVTLVLPFIIKYKKGGRP